MVSRQAAQCAEPMPLTAGRIEALSSDGCGIVRVNSKTVFIEGALPGEQVGFQIIQRQREYDDTRLHNIISCHLATLVRDVDYLMSECKYKLLSAGVADMFPHTAHVESMTVFARDGS